MYDIIINKGTVERVVQLSVGFSKDEFKRYCIEAQEFDFKPMVCEEFYNDLIDNYTSDNYQTILKGGNYTYEDVVRYFRGLEHCLSYFAYSRFLLESPVNSSAHGVTYKKTNHSEPVPYSERQQLAKRYNEKALQVYQDIKLFLDRNEDTYTSWKCNNSCGGNTNYISVETWS